MISSIIFSTSWKTSWTFLAGLSLGEVTLAEWEFGILVAEFLVVAGILVAELYGISLERRSYVLYKDFFESRSRWYNARGKRPRAGAPDSSTEAGAPPDSGLVVRRALSSSENGEREDVLQDGPDSSCPPGVAVLNEVEAEESGERTDADG